MRLLGLRVEPYRRADLRTVLAFPNGERLVFRRDAPEGICGVCGETRPLPATRPVNLTMALDGRAWEVVVCRPCALHQIPSFVYDVEGANAQEQLDAEIGETRP